MVEKSKFKPLIGQGSLIRGQEQDSVQGGLFDANQAFSGKLTQVEIWDVELPKTDIEKIAKCEVKSAKESNRIVSWISEKWEINGVTINEINLKNLCKPNPMMNQLVFLKLLEFLG